MDIFYKEIQHGVTGYAPFKGAYLVGTKWDGKFKDDDVKRYKRTKTRHIDSQDLIQEILGNPENEGIIFGGLEWSLQSKELIEMVKLASANGLKIMFHTIHSLGEFEARIGLGGASEVGYSKELKDMDASPEVYAMIGTMVLDFFIKEEYTIKTGVENVTFYTIKKEDKDESKIDQL